MPNENLSPESISEEPTDQPTEIVSEEQITDQEQEVDQEPPKDHKNSRIEKRFARLTKTLSQKDQELETLKQELESFRKSPQQPKEQETKSSPKVEQSGKPNPDDYTTYNEYIEALTDYKLEQKLKSKEVEATQSSRQEKYNQRVESFKQSSPDFSEVVQDVLPLIGNDNDLISYLIDSDHGPAILYKLANDPELLEKFEKSGKIKRSAIIGKIEEELEQPVKKTEPKQKVQAPKPVARVTTASSPTDRVPDENSSFAEWKRYRLSQKKK